MRKTAIDVDLAVQMKRDGKSLGQIAKHFNCTRQNISLRLKGVMDEIPRARSGPKPADYDAIRDRWRGGESISVIANSLRVSKSTVRRAVLS